MYKRVVKPSPPTRPQHVQTVEKPARKKPINYGSVPNAGATVKATNPVDGNSRLPNSRSVMRGIPTVTLSSPSMTAASAPPLPPIQTTLSETQHHAQPEIGVESSSRFPLLQIRDVSRIDSSATDELAFIDRQSLVHAVSLAITSPDTSTHRSPYSVPSISKNDIRSSRSLHLYGSHKLEPVSPPQEDAMIDTGRRKLLLKKLQEKSLFLREQLSPTSAISPHSPLALSASPRPKKLVDSALEKIGLSPNSLGIPSIEITEEQLEREQIDALSNDISEMERSLSASPRSNISAIGNHELSTSSSTTTSDRKLDSEQVLKALGLRIQPLHEYAQAHEALTDAREKQELLKTAHAEVQTQIRLCEKRMREMDKKEYNHEQVLRQLNNTEQVLTETIYELKSEREHRAVLQEECSHQKSEIGKLERECRWFEDQLRTEKKHVIDLATQSGDDSVRGTPLAKGTNELRELKVELETVQAVLELSNADVRTLQSKFESQKSEARTLIGDLEEQLKRCQVDFIALQTQYARVDVQIAPLQAKCSELQQMLDDERLRGSANVSELASRYGEQRTLLMGQIEDLKQQTALSHTKSRETESDSHTDLLKQLDDTKNALSELQSKLEEVEYERSSLEGDLDSMRGDLERSAELQQQLRSEAGELRKQLSALREERDVQSKQQGDRFSATSIHSDAEYDQQMQENSSLRTQISDLKSELSIMSGEHIGLQEVHSQLLVAQQNHSSIFDSLQSEVAALRASVQQHELGDSEREAQFRKAELVHQEIVAALKQQLSEAKSHEHLSDAGEQPSNVMSERLSVLELSLASKETELKQLTHSNAELSAIITELKSAVAEKDALLLEGEHKAAQLSTSVSNLRFQLLQLQHTPSEISPSALVDSSADHAAHVQDLKSQIASLKEANTASEESSGKVRAQLLSEQQRHTAECEQLRKQISDLRTVSVSAPVQSDDVQAVEMEISILTEAYSKSTKEAEQLKSQMISLQQQHITELSELQKTITVMRETSVTSEEHEDLVSSLESELRQLKLEYSQTMDRLYEAQDEHRETVESMKQAHAEECQTFQQTIAQLQLQHTTSSPPVSNSIPDNDSSSSSVHADLETTKLLAEQLKEQLRSVITNMEELERDNTSLEDEKETLEVEIQRLTKDGNDAKFALEQLKANIESWQDAQMAQWEEQANQQMEELHREIEIRDLEIQALVAKLQQAEASVQ